MDAQTRISALNAVFAFVAGLVVAILGLILTLAFWGLPFTALTPRAFTAVLLGLAVLGGLAVAIPLFILFERTVLGVNSPDKSE